MEGTAADWSYSPLRYWERDDDRMISFFAIGPDKPNGTDNSGNYNTNIQYEGLSHSKGETERHKVNYEYKFTVADNVQKQTDLIYATAVNQTHHDPTQTTGRKVNLNFKHALASIAFYAKLDQSYGEHVTITIKSVNLKGRFYTNGTLSLPITENGTATWSDKITPDSDRTFTIGATDCVLTEGEVTTSKLIYGDKAYVMVIPQVFGDNEIPQIEVT